MRDDDLETTATEFATALRMREPIPREIERELHQRLLELRDALGGARTIDRDLATLLVEMLVTSWASTPDYPAEERELVEESVASLGEAVMAAFTPDEMPPVPSGAP